MDEITIPTEVSMDWYLANVTASIDGGDQKCVTCGQRHYLADDDNGGVCRKCEAKGLPCHIVQDLKALFARKYNDLQYNPNLYDFENGIRNPICIVYSNGTFFQGNGNHRVAWSILNGKKSIRAVFSFRATEYMMRDNTGETRW